MGFRHLSHMRKSLIKTPKCHFEVLSGASNLILVRLCVCTGPSERSLFVNSKILSRNLFSRMALKYIFEAIKIR